ncbi:MAG TPA: 4Fe-4S binding protein [Anaerolineaceae bacterium]|nr:4Fe-4S binding protein [Anaerolineaceae bacterium]HPN50709.1 4Fe-4S binding protein [Anaerolineaceae bacterium]
MKIGALLGDVFRSLFKPPATERYPVEKKPAPMRLRGKLVYDSSKCTGCQLCAKDCPCDAIEIITIDRAAKRFIMRYRVDRCTFCAQCVESCRFGCLDLSNEEWELASVQKDPFTLTFGSEADLEAFLAKTTGAQPEAETKP